MGGSVKTFVLAPNEDWVCDRFVSEWYDWHPELSTHDPRDADVIWLLADWCWERVPTNILKNNPVLLTVHHIVPQKFFESDLRAFLERDKFVTAYHVPCKKTEEQVRELLKYSSNPDKQIFVKPFWVNQNLWKSLYTQRRDEKYDRTKDPKWALRNEIGIPDDAFVIGSFQRDTEGSDLVSPKLEKGPDLFCDAIIELHKQNPRVHVLLAGWRRQYVIKRLSEAGVPIHYEERPSFMRVNELYNMLDMYIVASRYEGGPQAIVECAVIGVPIVSRDVGVASEILDPACVGDDLVSLVKNFNPMSSRIARHNVAPFLMPEGINAFASMLAYVKRKYHKN